MASSRAAVILAAGRSTRMKSKRSKVLHSVGGRPLLEWVTALAKSVEADPIICVVGEGNADVRAAAEDLGLTIAVQEPQLGTGHAVLAAKSALSDFEGDMIVLYADTPLLETPTTEAMFEALETGADVAVMGFEPEDTRAYGRLVIEEGELKAIVEFKEATTEQRAIRLCNGGVMAASAKDMFSALERVTNANEKGEYYLTDIVEILRGDGKRAVAVTVDALEVMGVDARTNLAEAEMAFQDRMRSRMLESGVTLRDPSTTIFAYDTQIEGDVEVGANVVFGPGVSIATGTVIHPFCHIEGTVIGADAQIGPFARLRPGTEMATGSKAGNFVETKKARIGKGSKVNHLSYIGDADVGEGVNIGAGTITCNYDGFSKHKTTIGDGAFVGTHSSLVAPVKLGAGAYIGSGSVVTADVPDDALALGRARQVHKDGWAKRFRAAQNKRKSKKAQK